MTEQFPTLQATFTYDNSEGNLYYFTPSIRSPGPYAQLKVQAIVDIAKDGTLAGVELIDHMPPAAQSDEMSLFDQMHNLLKFWRCVDFEYMTCHDLQLLEDNVRDTAILLEKLKNENY